MGPIARRTIITGFAAAAALALTACKPGGGGDTDLSQDMSLGSATAKVTLIEYASPTCPHCAAWNEEVFPSFKAKYVDTGKVRYVLREAMIHGPPDAAVFMLARCAGKDRYFDVISRVFATQAEMYRGGTVRGVHDILRREAATLGIDAAAYEACVSDEAAFEALKARVTRADEVDKVAGTPTFDVNGVRVETPLGKEIDLATLDAAIAAAKKRK